MTEVISVKFKLDGAAYYFSPNGVEYSVGDHVIVETAQGIECAVVSEKNHEVNDEDIVKPLKKALRKATEKDLARVQENRNKARDAFKICEEKGDKIYL